MREHNESTNQGIEFKSPANTSSALSAEACRPASTQLPAGAPAMERRARWRRRIAMGLAGSLLLLMAVLLVPAQSSAQVSIGVAVSFGPPPLPVYVQPPCPAPGYIWTPGYWAWDPYYGYYWVPGTWVPAPFVGALWTPGYWGWNDSSWFWYAGYWGPVVGFYGGINYGFGYTGYGYYGGYWNQGSFYYNRAVNNIRVGHIRHYYNRRVVERHHERVSYNGGPGGLNVRPTSVQLAAARQRRFGPRNEQIHQRDFARNDPNQRATVNRGRPEVAATPRPGVFKGEHVVRATQAGGAYREPPARERNNPNVQRQAPVYRQRPPAVQQQRRPEPNVRTERPAPRSSNSERQVNRGTSPRVEQPRENRGNSTRVEQPNPNRGRATQEYRNNERRAAPQQRERPSQPPKGESERGRGPGKRSR